MKLIASVMAAALLASTAISPALASPGPAAATNATNLPKPECASDYGQRLDNLTTEAR